MKRHNAFWKAASILLAAVLVLACNAVGSPVETPTPEPTFTLEPTNTATPRPTSTPAPTSTPRPTATKVPPTPTPASKGETVTNGKIEVTVLDMFRHDKIVPGGMYWYRPNPGYLVIDLFVKAKNLTGGSLSIPWSDARISIDGKTSSPAFAGFKPASGNQKVAPLSFGYDELYNGSAFTFDDAVYLQIIYVIPDSKSITVLFGIQDAPLIQVIVK